MKSSSSNTTIVTIKSDMDAHWIPVFFTYFLRSKYRTKSRKGKPHDFNINVEVKIKTMLPYELVCADHKYVKTGLEKYPVVKKYPVRFVDTKLILFGGQEVILRGSIDYFKFVNIKMTFPQREFPSLRNPLQGLACLAHGITFVSV